MRRSTKTLSVPRSARSRRRIAACISVLPSLRGISVLALRSFASLGMTFVFLAPTAHADEIVLDNTAPSVLVSGAWTSASLTPGFTGANYLYRVGSTGDATVFWPFPLTAPNGRYEVYARWTS